MAWRLAVMLAAFLASAAAVVPIVFLMTAFVMGTPVFDPLMLDYLFVAFVLVNVLALGPASMAVAVAEWKRIRASLYFVLAGGLIALALTAAFGFAPGSDAEGVGLYIGASLTAAGLVAGFVYWWIAGRHAGALRDAWTERGRTA